MVLPQSMRLKGYKAFHYIHRFSKRYQNKMFLLRVAKANPGLIKYGVPTKQLNSFRCAVSISNKVSKKAVVRNRLRRMIHRHLLLKKIGSAKNQDRWIVISLKPGSLDQTSEYLLKECDKLFYEAGLQT